MSSSTCIYFLEEWVGSPYFFFQKYKNVTGMEERQLIKVGNGHLVDDKYLQHQL